MSSENVFVIPRKDISAIILNEQGETIFPPEYSGDDVEKKFHLIGQMPKEFFDLSGSCIPREIAEKDFTNLQIIPYISLVDSETKEIFIYRRGKASGEKRLSGTFSVGLGGHINSSTSALTNLGQLITKEAVRELQEEVGLQFTEEEIDQLYVGFTTGSTIIFTEADEVGCVHLGISLMISVKKSDLKNHELNVIENGQWLSVDEITKLTADPEFVLENWSKLVIMNIINHKNHIEQNEFFSMVNAEYTRVNEIFRLLTKLKSENGSIEAVAPEWEEFILAGIKIKDKLDTMNM